MSLKYFSLALLAIAQASPLENVARDEDCTPCNPQGASGTNPPSVGPELKDMYVDLLASVKDIHFRKRWAEPLSARDGDFCCRQTLDCVNVQSLNIPMCYDKFTTNFAFSDGSYGSLTTGDYTQGDAKANLISGDYTKGSESGNIYAQDPSAKPNTATLSIPPQWTGTGVGSAIPATGLGSVIVITTTIPGTTVSGATTLPALTTLGTTIPARTVTAATTIAPMTAVVTTTVDGSETAAASSSSKGAATQLSTDSTRSFGMSIITALLYAIYAL